MEDVNNNQSAPQQPAITPTPEASGAQGSERTFTQEEVNRIVSERLARERAKTEPSAEDAREADLKAREARMDCREYISAAGFPEALLDLFDTSDAEKFKAAVQRLDEIVQLPSPNRRIPRFTSRMGSGGSPAKNTAALLEEAFKPPEI